jgi:putative heme-binding domain-containing protein
MFGELTLKGEKSSSYRQRVVLRALASAHNPEVVSGLITQLDASTDTPTRKGILSALCRLHFHEGEWKGDSWGTRPDTRGPYYQPEPWSETPKIGAALKDALSKATPEEAAFLVSELNRNRIQFDEALDRILTLATKDAKLIPDAVGQLASAETIPAAGIPLLIQAAQIADASPQTLAQAITALAKTDSAEGCRASLTALVTLSKAQGSGKEQEAGRTAFLEAPKLENHHQLLEAEAEKLGTPTALWADTALLNLSARKTGSPESRELSGKALDAGWQNPQRRAQILKAVAQTKHHPYADKVLAALDDPDKAVAAAAKHAADAMKLTKRDKSSDPLIGTMKPEDVIAQVIKTKGDIELGEQLFTRQTCVACHTTSANQPPKGPFLGNIAQTYKRPDLALNILDPNKTIAQGFATNVFTLKDGTMNMGFVTDESGDKVTLRNIAAQEFTYKKSDITKRDTMPASIMPPGLVMNLTVKEFASLLDYLESLAKK